MAQITTFEGIDVGVPAATTLVDASLALAAQLHSGGAAGGDLQVASHVSRWAIVAALGAGTAMLAFASAKCTLARPPEDINPVTGPDGDLILRCGHSPPHEWDYDSGRRRSGI
jgi:hypothetical protein